MMFWQIVLKYTKYVNAKIIRFFPMQKGFFYDTGRTLSY